MEYAKLGFGLMRLPRLDGGAFDIPQIKKMVDEFMAAGFDYFDTANAYWGSEETAKTVLVDRYPRDSFRIASKLPGWALSKKEDVEFFFNQSLERLGIDYFDYYLLHSMENDRAHLQNYTEFGCFDFCRQKKKEGRIKMMRCRNEGFENKWQRQSVRYIAEKSKNQNLEETAMK